MGDSIKVTGKKIKCMEKGNILGKMEENTKENIWMTRSKDFGSINGQMVKSTKVNGKMENIMEKEKLF